MLAAHRLAAGGFRAPRWPRHPGRAFVRSRPGWSAPDRAASPVTAAGPQRTGSASRRAAVRARCRCNAPWMMRCSPPPPAERAGYVNSVAFSPDGRWLRVGQPGRHPAPLGGGQRPPSARARCGASGAGRLRGRQPDGRHIVSGAGTAACAGTPRDGREVAPMRARHAGAVYAIAFSGQPARRLGQRAARPWACGTPPPAPPPAMLRACHPGHALAFQPGRTAHRVGDEAGAR